MVLSYRGLGDAARGELAAGAQRPGLLQYLRRLLLGPIDDQVVAQGRQFECDTAADAPAGAGDDGDGSICHDKTPLRSMGILPMGRMDSQDLTPHATEELIDFPRGLHAVGDGGHDGGGASDEIAAGEDAPARRGE